MNTIRKRWWTRRKQQTCLFCGLVLANLTNLQRHLYRHTGEQPYFCKYCDATFKYSWTKTYHENKTHLPLKHKCINCELSFNDRQTLTRHLKKKHSILSSIEGGTPASSFTENSETTEPKDPTPNPSESPNSTTTLCPPPLVKKTEGENKMIKRPPPLRLFGLPLNRSVHGPLPVREKPKWDPSFFLHMNRYKMDESSSNVEKESKVSNLKEPPRINHQLSKSKSSQRAEKLVGISKVKKRQSKRLLVKSTALEEGKGK